MIRNLTPHSITILSLEASPRMVLPSDGVARCTTEVRPFAGSHDGVTLSTVRFGPVTGLPPAEEGTLLVVSALVLDHPSTASRTDLASPGELVRGPDGQPIGCLGLRVRGSPDVGALVAALRTAAIEALADLERGIDNEHREGCSAAAFLAAFL